MVYDEKLAEGIRKIIGKDKDVTEKHMFGGLSFMYGEKMFCGVLKDDLVLKMSLEECQGALKKPNVRPMDFTGIPMKSLSTVKQRLHWDTRNKKTILFLCQNEVASSFCAPTKSLFCCVLHYVLCNDIGK